MAEVKNSGNGELRDKLQRDLEEESTQTIERKGRGRCSSEDIGGVQACYKLKHNNNGAERTGRENWE